MPSSDSKSLSVRLSNTSPSTRLRLNCAAYCRTHTGNRRCCWPDHTYEYVAIQRLGCFALRVACYVATSAARTNAFCESGDASMLGTSGMPRSPSQAITCCWSQPSKPTGAAAPKSSTVPQAHANMCRVDPWGVQARHTLGAVRTGGLWIAGCGWRRLPCSGLDRRPPRVVHTRLGTNRRHMLWCTHGTPQRRSAHERSKRWSLWLCERSSAYEVPRV